MAGKSDGTLTQYKPDLKEAKSIPAPPSSAGGRGVDILICRWTLIFFPILTESMGGLVRMDAILR